MQLLARSFQCLGGCRACFIWLLKTARSRHCVSARQHLVVPQPDAAVGDAECQHVVQEGLAARVPPRRRKGLRQHLLQQLQVRLVVEGLRAGRQPTHFVSTRALSGLACRKVHGRLTLLPHALHLVTEDRHAWDDCACA